MKTVKGKGHEMPKPFPSLSYSLLFSPSLSCPLLLSPSLSFSLVPSPVDPTSRGPVWIIDFQDGDPSGGGELFLSRSEKSWKS